MERKGKVGKEEREGGREGGERERERKGGRKREKYVNANHPLAIRKQEDSQYWWQFRLSQSTRFLCESQRSSLDPGEKKQRKHKMSIN